MYLIEEGDVGTVKRSSIWMLLRRWTEFRSGCSMTGYMNIRLGERDIPNLHIENDTLSNQQIPHFKLHSGEWQ